MQILIFTFLLILPTISHACAVCFGGADGDLVRGFTWGVAVLGLLPFVLITGLVTLVIRSTKKNNTHE